MKPIARMPTKKSYSWWWDSHINSKNSKWLADNLEEMDRCVKEMLGLIEGEGDSFAKKADMYYQRRPDLIAHVEDFLRMYRALAERYNNVTGELRKNVPSQLQSQGSGNGSDFGSEPDSPSPEFIPERRPPRPKPGPRPAGFDFFLGSAGSSNNSRKGSKGSSSSESDSDSDDSKHADGDGDGDGDSSVLHQRIHELENELHITIEKLHEYEEKHFHDQDEHLENGDHIDCTSKISALEKQLKEADDKILVADEDILNIKQMLEEKKLSSVADEVEHMFEENRALEAKIVLNKQEIEDLKAALASVNQQFEADISHRDDAFEVLKTELSSLSQTYLNEKIRLESIIANLEGSIGNLKEERKHFSEENSLLARKDIDRDFLIRELQANAATSAEQYLHEKTHLEGIIANLEGSIGKLKEEIKRISEDGSLLERKHIDQAGLIRELQANAAISAEQFLKEKCALEARLSGLSLSHDSLEAEFVSLVSEITQLRAVSAQQLEELSRNLKTVKLDVDRLSIEKEELGAKVNVLIIDVKSRDDRINELNEHLHQLHFEHVKLITELETRKEAAGLCSRVRELEEEVDRQRAVIADSAEGKREAIRQLCFSLRTALKGRGGR